MNTIKRALVLLLSLTLVLGPCQGAFAMPGDEGAEAPAVTESGGEEAEETGGGSTEEEPGEEKEEDGEEPDENPDPALPGEEDTGGGDGEEVPAGEERPDADKSGGDEEKLLVLIEAEDAVILRGSSFDLLEDVAARDENGGPVEVELDDDGGFDPGEAGEYRIDYISVHPVSGEEFKASRTVTVAAFLYDPQPESAEEVQAIVDLWTEAVLAIYGDGEIDPYTIIELDYYAGDENTVSGEGIFTAKDKDDKSADLEEEDSPEEDTPANPEEGEEADANSDPDEEDGGETAAAEEKTQAADAEDTKGEDQSPAGSGSGEEQERPDGMLPYKVTMGAELLTDIEGELFEELEAVFPELPKWKDAIDESWLPAGWAQEKRTDPDSGEEYWTLAIGIMRMDGQDTDLSGKWSYVKNGSGSSETASNTTTINVEDLSDSPLFPNGMPGFYYSATNYRYYQYNANFIVNFPTKGNTYKVRAAIPEGWNITVNNFPLDKAGYLTGRTLTTNPDNSFTLEYTVDDTISGTTTFNFSAMYLNTTKMYPGMNLDIKVELLDLTSGSEVVLATQELKAQIRKYDNRSVYYQFGSNGASSVTQDPAQTWGDPALADGYAPESGTRNNTIYTYKGGDLSSSNWGVTSSSYDGETTLKHDISEFELNLSKLYVSTQTSTNSTYLSNPSLWEKITPDQLKNLEVTGTSVDNYDPDTGIVTFKGSYQSFSFGIQLKNWNNPTIWPRSALATSGNSGYTTLLMPSAAGFDTDGQIASTPDHLYLNGIQTEDAKATFTNNGKFIVAAYWQFYQTYTPTTTYEPVYFYLQAPSRLYYSYWQTGTAYQPLFRFGMYTRQYTSGTTHYVSPELYDLSLDIDIPADLTVTHLAVPVHKGDAYYSDRFTLSYGGHDETVYFRGSSAEDAIIELGVPISGGSTVTFHIDYYSKEQQYFNTSDNSKIGSAFIEFIGDADSGASGSETLGVTKTSISARLNDPTAAPTIGYNASNGTAIGNAGYGYTVSGVTMTYTEPTQYSRAYTPTFYAVSGGAPHTSGTNDLVIGEAYYLSTYVLGHATTTSSNQKNSPLVYNGDGSWLDPVLYMSLPHWMTTVRGDTNFTDEDLFTYIPGVQSVRTVPGVSGYYSGGTLVEVKFDSDYPHTRWDDPNSMTFDAKYAWNSYTSQMGTYNSANTPRIFLKFKVKMDSVTFPDQKTYHTLDSRALLAGSYSGDRAESPAATISKSVLDADGGRTAAQLSGAPFYIDSSGENLQNASDNYTFNVQWKENAYLSMGMKLEDGTFFEYIPEGENKTDDADIPEMKAGDVGTMRVQIINHSSYDLTTGSGSYATLELPKDNSGSNYWKTTALSALVIDDDENTVSPGLVTPMYSDDGGLTFSTTFPISGNVTHISLDVSTIPKGSVYSATFQFQVPRVNNDALYGTIGVGETDYDLGVIGGTSVKSDAGNTAALKLKKSDPPSIAVGGPKRLEYKLNTGDDITGWMTDYTVTDDITQNMVLAPGYPRVFFTPISEGVTGTRVEITPVNASSVNNLAKGKYEVVYRSEDDYDRQHDEKTRIIEVTDTTEDDLTVKYTDYAIQKGSSTNWMAWFATDAYVDIDKTQDPIPNYSKLAVISSPTFDVNTSNYYNLAFTYTDPEGNISMTASRVKVGNLGTVGLAPELDAWDVTMGVGSGDATSYYWTKNTSATDVEDGNLTSDVYVTAITDIYGNSWTGLSPSNLPPTFDPNTPNRYEVSYEVKDSDGNTDTATAVVMVANYNGTDYDPWIVAPAGKSVPSNVTVGYDFTVINPNSTPINLTLTLTSQHSHTATLPGGTANNRTITANYGVNTVSGNVTMPAGLINGYTDDLTLSTTYRSTPISGDTTTTIDNTLPYQEVYIVSQNNTQLVARVNFQNLPGNPATADTTVRLLDSNGVLLTGTGREIRNTSYANDQPTFVFDISDLTFNTPGLYQIQSEVVGVNYPSTKPFALTSYHTVTFHPNGGSSVAPINNVPYDTTVSAPASPDRTGYTFVNWYIDNNVWSNVWVFPVNKVTGDTNLYARWNPRTFNVTFDVNDTLTGSTAAALSGPSSITVTYDQKYGALPTASRDGYTFAGWYTAAQGGSQVTANTDVKILANQTLYAHWTVKSHTVTFNKNDGVGSTTAANPNPASKLVTFDQPYGALAATSRTGYTFGGWYTLPTAGTQVTAGTSMTTDSAHTLYSQWNPNNYTVTFDPNGGDPLGGSAAKTVTFDQTYGALPTPNRLGYFFQGWYTQPAAGTPVSSGTSMTTAGNHTLYAHWSEAYLDVTYHANGGAHSDGTTAKIVTVRYDYPYGTPPPVTRPGFSVKGWFTAPTGGNEVTADTIVATATNHDLYAQWNVTMTYDTNGGNAVPSQTVDEGKPVSRPADPVKEGFDFAGWYADNGTFLVPWNFGTPLAQDTTVYARWLVHVEFNTNGGSPAISPVTGLEIGSTVSRPADPGKPNLTFDGWYYDDYTFQQPFGFDTDPISQNTTVYAKWIAVITFDVQGGAPDVPPIYDAVDGHPISWPTPEPTMPDYALTGWGLEPECLNLWDFDNHVVTGNTTLYAKWTKIHKVTFQSAGGSYIAPNNHVLDGTLLPWPGLPTRKGYEFVGWYKSSTAWNFQSDLVFDDLILTARWRSNTPGTDTPDGNKPDGGDGGSAGGGGGGSGEGPGDTGEGSGFDENGELITIGDDQVPLGDLPIGSTGASGDSILGINPFTGDTRRGAGLMAGLLAASAATLAALRKKRRRTGTSSK